MSSKTSTATHENSTEIATQNTLPDDVLGAIKSFADADAALMAAGVPPESASDYGTGFSTVLDKNKDVLLGVDMILLNWRFNKSEYGNGVFVSAEVITRNGDKFILNDGSTGICQQLRSITDKRLERKHSHPQVGLRVEGGLRVSRFYFNSDTGAVSTQNPGGSGWAPAATYYLAD